MREQVAVSLNTPNSMNWWAILNYADECRGYKYVGNKLLFYSIPNITAMIIAF
jgi:hypothetical protein